MDYERIKKAAFEYAERRTSLGMRSNADEEKRTLVRNRIMGEFLKGAEWVLAHYDEIQ